MSTPILEHLDLDREPWRSPGRDGAVWVFRGVSSTLVVAESPPQDAREAWLVDRAPHSTAVMFGTAGLEVTWSVHDPVAVVRSGVTDAEAACRAFLLTVAPELERGAPEFLSAVGEKLRGRSFTTPEGLSLSDLEPALWLVTRSIEEPPTAEPGGTGSFRARPRRTGPEPDDHPWWIEQERERSPFLQHGDIAVVSGRGVTARTAETPADPGGRQLVAQMPAGVPLGEPVGLQVRIAGPDYQGPVSAAARLRAIPVQPGGTEVTLVVHAGSGLIADGPLLRVVRVPEHGDSDPVLFPFLAVALGLHKVDVKAYAGGSFLAELRAEVSVADQARRIDAPAQRAALGPLTGLPGEVTLQVQAAAGGHYVFQVLSDRTQFSPVTVSSLAGPPGPAVEQVLIALGRIARGADYTGRNARQWLRQSGVNLWNQLIPAAVKEQFWQVRDAMSAFTVASGHDVVPWELLYPLRPGEDEGFLIEQMPVVRRVFDQARSREIGLGEPRYVVPEGSPADALEEVAAVAARLGHPAGPVIDELDELLDLVETGRLGMAHFACHNNYRAEAGGSSIRLRNGAFLPVMLSAATVGRSLARHRPLIFINACRSASDVPQYTRMMGWAQQFMAAGAGAFVGTLWDIRSRSAAAFADGFYQRLADGRTLGEAAHETRLASAYDRGDPTWLAYSVYGDPAATASDSVS